tara:strand:- start:1214 stop:1573 length:360 start_codon:yes stop_codon:yes gene_type:complete
MADKKTAGIDEFASRFIDVVSMPWVETAPGHETKVLMHDPETGMITLISRIAPGGTIPFHVHEDLEQTYILEGSFKDDEGECTAGNFVIRPKGSKHSPVAPNGCTMLVFEVLPGNWTVT